MTKEEAIKGLKVLRKDFSEYKPNEEMFDMAIEALEQKPCDDCISRKEVLDIDFKKIMLTTANPTEMIEQKIKALSSITPQPKTGYWIEHPHETGENWEYSRYECSECHVWEDDDSDYCPNCGTKMEAE